METVLQIQDRVVKSWVPAEEIWCAGELSAQVEHLCRHPAVWRQVALMPDVHLGMGMPIGGVIACPSAVIPNAVGSDIGCGMIAAELDHSNLGEDLAKLERARVAIRELVPVGRKWHDGRVFDLGQMKEHGGEVVERERDKIWLQLGTLGGGNHFIEIQQDRDTGVNWVMIHSGSRNIGKQVCDEYNAEAKKLNLMYHSPIPANWGLSFLPDGDVAYSDYLAEMRYCLEFAKLNRWCLMESVLAVLSEEWDIAVAGVWDVHHNYAEMEHHFGKDVMVHRKGATRARAGDVCIIPGSQAENSDSFIGEGLGNPDSWMSCSHGAGRLMGRRDAKQRLDFGNEQKGMGAVLSDFSERRLDEAGGAYKDVGEVMRRQEDLVKITARLKTLAVVKE